MLNKTYFSTSNSGEKIIPSFCLYSEQKSTKQLCKKAEKSQRSHFESVRVYETLKH
jgi:hypothetical protein